MKTKVLFLGLVIASMASANAQTFNKNNYAFEVGKMAANLSVKSSCNWWLQDNDVFAVTDSKNHTPNGKHSLCFKSESILEKLKMACGIQPKRSCGIERWKIHSQVLDFYRVR